MFTRHQSAQYIILLVIIMLYMMPSGIAVAQSSNSSINKPTRERVRDKKSEQAGKQDAAPVKKQDQEPVKKAAPAPAAKPAAKPDSAKPGADSAAARAAAPAKPKKTPLNTEKVQFDGIDVSKHQGDIDWEEMKKHPKVKFAYIKATEGSDYIDPRYKHNIKEARRHGLKVGSYHFLTNKSSAKSQFINFAKTASRDEQDLIPIIDVEVCNRWSSQQLRDSLKVFADLLEDYYGCKPMIYTSEKFFTKHLGRAFADYPLFIAKYNTVQPNVGYKWILWQFSDCGLFSKSVKGNRGEVDLSRFNKGCTVNDILYRPAKGKPKISVMDAVDKNKEKPATINLTEHGKSKEVTKPTAKQQQEEEQRVARAKKANEREQRVAEENAKKKAKEKAEADKKAKAQAERDKREKARLQEKERKAKEEAEAKQRKAAEQKAKAEADAQRKAAEQKAEAEAKAKRKAAAQKAKQEKAKQSAAGKTGKASKSASLLGTSSARMSQAQQGDSIRNARYKGRKINKSSADND